jgi:hypothetical protein
VNALNGGPGTDVPVLSIDRTTGEVTFIIENTAWPVRTAAELAKL